MDFESSKLLNKLTQYIPTIQKSLPIIIFYAVYFTFYTFSIKHDYTKTNVLTAFACILILVFCFKIGKIIFRCLRKKNKKNNDINDNYGDDNDNNLGDNNYVGNIKSRNNTDDNNNYKTTKPKAPPSHKILKIIQNILLNRWVNLILILITLNYIIIIRTTSLKKLRALISAVLLLLVSYLTSSKPPHVSLFATSVIQSVYNIL